ncbi:hypothetical protein DFH06DRAFT_1350103 [Mycena polygramma]|nr:hypothetical protein DFH06DRAFT_1350103 [Mycena polygramma]
MQDLITKPIMEDDIIAMIVRKPYPAQRRQDHDEVWQIGEQLAKVVESGPPTPAEDDPADRLSCLNERDRKANMKAVLAARSSTRTADGASARTADQSVAVPMTLIVKRFIQEFYWKGAERVWVLGAGRLRW